MMESEFWQDNETFIDEGVPIEPFNLDKEREEGYFDDDGNYVEYVTQNEMKVLEMCIIWLFGKYIVLTWKLQDAWLDSVDVHPKYTGKNSVPANNDDKPRDLGTEELAEINRRISDVLEPGETVSFYHKTVAICKRCLCYIIFFVKCRSWNVTNGY